MDLSKEFDTINHELQGVPKKMRTFSKFENTLLLFTFFLVAPKGDR